MFIRQTRTGNRATGESYVTYRLVRTERIGGKIRQITVLNLGRHFPIKPEDWPILCSRLEQLLNPQAVILPVECSESIERTAQRYHAQLVARAPVIASATEGGAGSTGETRPPADFQEVDVDSLQMTQPRSVGVEHVGLHAASELGLIETLNDLGVKGVVQASILGNLIGRMGQPGSERATWNWLQQHSALGELIDVDFLSMSHMCLYRASDVLMKHREVIETRLFRTARMLFELPETVTLYDLSNTYFEGEAELNCKAKRGRSKEKRSDCPLVTLGLVLDGSGFVRRSQTFAGNVAEPGTLASMLAGLGTPAGALVVMDAGIATDANVAWLVEHGYRYLVVRRGGMRQSDATRLVSIESAGERWQKVPVPGTMATHPGVYCLRTNELAWDEEKLWRTYTMLTDLESVFRSLKSEFGLRPIYHHKEVRSDGHLFITVLAYQCVQFLRVKLKAAGITGSWATLRDILSLQRRVTATFSQRDGRSLHVRKATVAEPDLLAIYRALGISAAPGGIRKLIS
jgi:hypothetical protein